MSNLPMLLLVCLSVTMVEASSDNLHGAIDTYIVQTDLGNIRGFSKLVLGQKLYIFSGIPYAKPPTGRRRFRKPVPVTPWDGVLDATRLPNTCVQVRGH